MLYVLTPGLIDDLKALSQHPGMVYRHEMQELILYDHGFSTIENVIYDAVRHLNIVGHSASWLIARVWYSNDPAVPYPYDGSRSSDLGMWVYQYGRISEGELILSRKCVSNVIEYTGNKFVVHLHGSITKGDDIVNSKDPSTFKMLIPGENTMFLDEKLKYKIPLSLLK